MRAHLLPAVAMISTVLTGRSQITDTPSEVIAGIPANYTEANTGSYTLPDPLKFADGSAVRDAKAWFEKRRPELFKLVEENQYGRVPPRPPAMTFDVFDRGTPAFEGKAVRKQVAIYFTASRTENYVDVLIYRPAHARGPSPVLLEFGWMGNNLAVAADPGIKPGRQWVQGEARRIAAMPRRDPARGVGRLENIPQILERGYAVAVFNYTDIEPDALNGFSAGIRSAYLKPGATAPAADEWGAIAAWGWGASRIIDYFETDPEIDATRIAILGASRLGKTALWTAARDERVACAIVSVSGEGGAALSRRNYGETIAHLVAPTRFPYQFARNYQPWSGRASEMPWDAHTIIALVAPRPVLLQTGSTDNLSDPYGEFLAAKAATPVYHLLGKKGIEEFSQPPTGKPIMNDLGYLMHKGPHGIMPGDWPVFLDFLDQHMKSRP
jgi:hypothetical protein